MAEPWFDLEEDVASQVIDPDNASATDDELEEALAPIFVNLASSARAAKHHDRRGYFADEADSTACRALGHTFTRDSEGNIEDWTGDDHVTGFDGGLLCTETRWGSCCTECESEDCEATRLNVSVWSAPGVTGVGRA